MADFDIERFVRHSKALDTSDIDWAEARRVGLLRDEVQLLQYMQDTESHIMMYLRDLLSGYAVTDPEVTTFLACWVYEETHHGRALDRMLVETGAAAAANERHARVHTKTSTREMLTGALGRLAAQATPHFSAVHMAWGAINEFIAAMSYTQMARLTQNRPLQLLLNRLAKDERRHFAFYYDQAEKRLLRGGAVAQSLCRVILTNFWKPVGLGVGSEDTGDMICSYSWSDQRGRRDVIALDEMVRTLPGMEVWGETLGKWRDVGLERFRREHPERYADHRRAEAARDGATTESADIAY
jgi:hypothetical protein